LHFGVKDMTYLSNVIFDVGLHKGEDAEFYLKKGFNVVAFEADPDLVEHCARRFREHVAQGRLRIVEGAIAPETAGERLTFYKNVQKSVWGTIEASWADRNRRLGTDSIKIEVPRTDLSSVFQKYGMPYYLKSDIEGADHLVLQELQKRDGRPCYISIEAEKVDFAWLRDTFGTLQGLGYTAFKAIQQATIPGMKIVTTTVQGEPVSHVFAYGASGPFGEDLPGAWSDHDACLHQFETIFRLYRLFGDDGIVSRAPGGALLMRGLARLYRKPLPGWYDIHARLG
jgi:FkbM family methyltransferase